MMAGKGTSSDHKLPLIRSQSQQQPNSRADMCCINVERCDNPRIVEECSVGGGCGGGVGGGVPGGDYVGKWTTTLCTQEQCRAESSPQLCRKDSCSKGGCRVVTSYGSTNELVPMIGSIDNMSTTCNVGLLRSMSARTVDSVPGLDSSASGSESGPKMLLALPTDSSSMTCRSTSCPSMAYPPLPCKGHVGNPQAGGGDGGGSRADYAYVHDARDVNLEGEVIADLPVDFDPSQTFPDLIPELQLEPGRQYSNGGVLGSGRGAGGGLTVNFLPHGGSDTGDHRRLCQKYELSKQFISIGELPSGVARGVITDPKSVTGTSMPNVDVTEKCRMWLDTLSLSEKT